MGYGAKKAVPGLGQREQKDREHRAFISRIMDEHEEKIAAKKETDKPKKKLLVIDRQHRRALQNPSQDSSVAADALSPKSARTSVTQETPEYLTAAEKVTKKLQRARSERQSQPQEAPKSVSPSPHNPPQTYFQELRMIEGRCVYSVFGHFQYQLGPSLCNKLQHLFLHKTFPRHVLCAALRPQAVYVR